MKTIEITEREAGQRLDKFLGKYMSLAPKSFFYKMLRKKNIVLNGKKAEGSERLAEGDSLTLYLADETIEKFVGTGNETIEKFVRTGDLCYEENIADGDSPHHREDSAEGGSIVISTTESTDSRFKKKPSFTLVYEDENILVLNKPWGMLTQKAKPEDISLNEHMIAWLLNSGRMTEDQLKMQKPSVCNRLDRNTSGIVLAGISLKGLQGLSRILKDRTGKKLYYALVWGQVKEARQLKGYLVKDTNTNQVRVFSVQGGMSREDFNKKDAFLPGSVYEARRESAENTCRKETARYIETVYRPLGYGGGCTLLEIHLITGRSHQIRAHLSAEGHCIIGDPKYGNQEINREFSRKYGLKGQLLHAGRFVMPADNCPFPGLAGKEFTAPLEPRFEKVLDGVGIPVPAELKNRKVKFMSGKRMHGYVEFPGPSGFIPGGTD